MRFVQVHSFYDWYLNEFYRNNPTLADQSLHAQIKALLNDGFSGSHLFAPYLYKHGFDPDLIIANCRPAQAAWARENGCAELIDHPHWLYLILHCQLQVFRPEILYLSHPVDFDSRFVRSLPNRPALVMGWRAAAISDWNDFSEFDLILSSDPVSKRKLLEHGARAVQHFVPGFPSFLAERVLEVRKKHDVVFCGQWGREHTRRNRYLEQVAERLPESSRAPSIALYFASTNPEEIPGVVARFNHGARWGLSMHQALREGKVALNAVIDFARGEAGNMRQFEITGSGSFMLTEDHPTLSLYFNVGTEIESYKSESELLEKILYYLEHEDAREEIARRGQLRCLRDHSIETRAIEFSQIIENQLSRKRIVSGKLSFPLKNTTHDDAETKLKIEALMQLALDNLSEGAAEEALTKVIEGKNLRLPVQNLEHLRAMCFIQLNRLTDAKEALLEELRQFPGNYSSAKLLEEVKAEEGRVNG